MLTLHQITYIISLFRATKRGHRPYIPLTCINISFDLWSTIWFNTLVGYGDQCWNWYYTTHATTANEKYKNGNLKRLFWSVVRWWSRCPGTSAECGNWALPSRQYLKGLRMEVALWRKIFQVIWQQRSSQEGKMSVWWCVLLFSLRQWSTWM